MKEDDIMKKKIIIVIFFICLMLFGCGKKADDKYADYEHYSEKQFDNSKGEPVRYIFNNDREHNIYVVTNVTNEEGKLLLYKVGENNYISLKKFINNEETFDAYFYQDWKNDLNKLYIISGDYFEYILDKEKVTSKKLDFDIPDIPQEIIKEYEKDTGNKVDNSYAEIYGIKDVSNEFIYFRANLHNLYRTVTIKCSLDSFDCEYSEE